MNSNLVIENTTIVTMNPNREVLYNASIVISNDKIVAIGIASPFARSMVKPNSSTGTGRWSSRD
jgi:predicted amidohydrolase YtcJ